MHRKHHDDEQPVEVDPAAALVWQVGLSHRPSGQVVIKAPHAGDLVTRTAQVSPAQASPAQADAA